MLFVFAFATGISFAKRISSPAPASIVYRYVHRGAYDDYDCIALRGRTLYYLVRLPKKSYWDKWDAERLPARGGFVGENFNPDGSQSVEALGLDGYLYVLGEDIGTEDYWDKSPAVRRLPVKPDGFIHFQNGTSSFDYAFSGGRVYALTPAADKRGKVFAWAESSAIPPPPEGATAVAGNADNAGKTSFYALAGGKLYALSGRDWRISGAAPLPAGQTSLTFFYNPAGNPELYAQVNGLEYKLENNGWKRTATPPLP